MCDDVTEKNPVLVGFSFGGIMVQEMYKFLNVKKTIIISSVKQSNELPKRFQMVNFTKAYKFLLPRLFQILKNMHNLFWEDL